MAVRVVDLLEVVEVEDQDSRLEPVVLTPLPLAFAQMPIGVSPVEEAGELVGVRDALLLAQRDLELDGDLLALARGEQQAQRDRRDHVERDDRDTEGELPAQSESIKTTASVTATPQARTRARGRGRRSVGRANGLGEFDGGHRREDQQQRLGLPADLEPVSSGDARVQADVGEGDVGERAGSDRRGEQQQRHRRAAERRERQRDENGQHRDVEHRIGDADGGGEARRLRQLRLDDRNPGDEADGEGQHRRVQHRLPAAHLQRRSQGHDEGQDQGGVERKKEGVGRARKRAARAPAPRG